MRADQENGQQQQEDDLGPGAKLPVECIELIVSHIEDLWTLWSLLTVNKCFAAVVLRRLYMNPYRSILMGFLFHEGIPIRRLAQRILTLTHVSPDDPYIESMKRVLKIHNAPSHKLQPNQSTWVDYLALVREVEWPNDIWTELHEFFHEVGADMVKDFQLRKGNTRPIDLEDPRWSCPPALVQSTLTWALCGGSAEQLGRIKKLWIPIQDLERFLDPTIVAQLTQLEEVVFDGRYATINTDFEATFQKGIDFVRAHRRYHLSEGSNGSRTPGESSGSGRNINQTGGARLDSARFERLSWRGYEHLERELYLLLPPLNKPRHLTKLNWDRFMIKSTETDTSRVESIFYEEPEKVNWDPYLPQIPSFLLPSCRRLVRLRLHIRAREAATIFRWAVEEKNRWIAGGNSQSNNVDTLVPLEELDLTCDRGTMQHVIQGAMFAFGHSLRIVNILPTVENTEDSDSEAAFYEDINGIQTNNNSMDDLGDIVFDHGQQSSFHQGGSSMSRLCIGAGWNLPRLVRLCIVSNGPLIDLDPKALANSQRLELVRLKDDAVTPVSLDHRATRSIMRQTYDEWILPKTTRIKLVGHSATKFNPRSLAWMKQLTWLELSQRTVIDIALTTTTSDNSSSLTGQFSSPPSMTEGNSPVPVLSSSSSSSSTELHTNPWTWDWDLPALQTLILAGDTALLFELKLLKHTPNLRALSLDIQQIEREFSWTPQCNVEVPNLEELSLLGRWSISNETLQYILLGSSGITPSPSSTLQSSSTNNNISSTVSSSDPKGQTTSNKSETTTTTTMATASSVVTIPCPVLARMQLNHCQDFSLRVLVQACEQRRPRTLTNVRCSQTVPVHEAGKMGLELLDPSYMTYSNPYLNEVSYHNWVMFHNRSQGLFSMLSSPTSNQQPTVCVYTLGDINYRPRKWPWHM
ncbi:hypothetical protein BGW42_003026 [Actinomortierella wolfii]|nr:hypothetical protein BGW42_003026 [Actinomortierella wolfii]